MLLTVLHLLDKALLVGLYVFIFAADLLLGFHSETHRFVQIHTRIMLVWGSYERDLGLQICYEFAGWSAIYLPVGRTKTTLSAGNSGSLCSKYLAVILVHEPLDYGSFAL